MLHHNTEKTQIGKPVDQLHMANIQISQKIAQTCQSAGGETKIFDDWLAKISKHQLMLFKGELSTH